jgi:CRISPR-associated protein Cas1
LWQIFYGSFKYILAEEFEFETRKRRPPDNPMNALISFGNSLLYAYTLSKIYHTQLNPTISYLHEPSERRFSLSLDLCEVFKVPLVFGTIFTLVNKKMLQVEKHFDQQLNFALLNEEGRKIFARERDKRLEKTLFHPILKKNTSYGSMIKYDCYKLIKHLL